MRIKKNIGYFDAGKGAASYNKSLFEDLNDLSFEQMLHFLLTDGNVTKEKYRKVLIETVKVAGFTDPRLWPNRIAGYCGENNTTINSALIGAISSTDSKVYGSQPMIRCYRLVKEINDKFINLEKDEIINYIETKYDLKTNIPGFNRIISQYDDRVPHIIKMIKKHKLENERPIKIMKIIQHHMNNKYNSQMNLALVGGSVSLMADIREDQIANVLVALGFLINSIPSFMDGLRSDKPFIEVKDNEIIYEGVEKRKWSR